VAWNGAGGAAIVLLVLVLGIVGPYALPTDPIAQNLRLRLQAPGSAPYWLGTDQLGRDMLSRLVFGARVSLSIAFAAVVGAAAIGSVVGLLGGFYPRIAGVALMRLADVAFAIPYILMALALVTVVGPGARNIVLVLIATRWVVFARVLYGEALALRGSDFISGARAAGASETRILGRYVVPNVLNSLVVLVTLELAFAIITESALTFLGLGVQPPTPSWGWMLSDGRNYLAVAWWVSTIPGLGIMATVLGFNLLGDWLRDRVDPRLRRGAGG
jgi:peptide/nickel transport system permease protein